MVLSWAYCFSLPSNAQEISVTGLDPGQVYSTGNIVQPTTTSGTTPWVNGVYQDSLTCWTWGNPGYCGPQAIVRPGGNINFSFGMTNLYQMQDIASVLPQSGTGLRVDGYNFGFTAKNGNGWDNGNVDYLNAYVSIYNKDGSVAYNKNYDLTYKYNWTTFNFNETFTSPYAAKDLGSVQYGLVGQDWNGWAGPYGPEVYNVSFSLRYSVDPCASNPLWSPTCPGYLDALAKIVPASSPTQSASLSPTSESTTPEPTTLLVTPTSSSSSSQSQNTTTLEPTQTASAPQSTSSSTATVAAVETRSDPQKKSGPNLSQIMNIVGSELNRISQLESKTVSETTAQAAAAAQSAVSQAEAVAGNLTNQSIATSIEQSQAQSAAQSSQSQTATSQAQQTNIQSQQRAQSSQTTVQSQSTQLGTVEPTSMLQPPMPPTPLAETQNENSAPVATVQQSVPVIENQTQIQADSPEQMLNPLYSLVVGRTINLPMIEPIDNDQNKNGPAILSNIPRPEQAAERPTINESQNLQPSGPSVRRGGRVEGMDGGADMNQLAAAPADFNSYLNSQLRDAQFYASKEIYRGQRNVDNARVLRGLGTDRLHQEMVNQQYNQGAQ